MNLDALANRLASEHIARGLHVQQRKELLKFHKLFRPDVVKATQKYLNTGKELWQTHRGEPATKDYGLKIRGSDYEISRDGKGVTWELTLKAPWWKSKNEYPDGPLFGLMTAVNDIYGPEGYTVSSKGQWTYPRIIERGHKLVLSFHVEMESKYLEEWEARQDPAYLEAIREVYGER